MRRILAIDTTTRWGGIALVTGGSAGTEPVVIAESGWFVDESHTGGLPARIERLLGEAGWSKRDLDAFAATRGPGSFTGIRVGLGLLRGLALATGRPCFGVTTLEALVAAHGPSERARLGLIAAGRGELYGCRFDAAGRPPIAEEPPWVAPQQDAVARGAERGALLIPAPGTELALPASSAAAVAPAPRGIAAAAGCLVAWHHPGLAGPVPPLTPVYVRPPDVRLERR